MITNFFLSAEKKGIRNYFWGANDGSYLGNFHKFDQSPAYNPFLYRWDSKNCVVNA